MALGSAAFGGAADFIGGTVTRRVSPVVVVWWNQAIGLSLVVAYLTVTWSWPDDWGFAPWAVLAGLSSLLGLVSFYLALAVGKMSIVAPIPALGVIVPLLWGVMGGERPQAVQLVGIAVAILGVVLSTGPEVGGGLVLRPILLASFAAVCFGCHMSFLSEAAAESVTGTVAVMKLTMVLTVIGGALFGAVALGQGVPFLPFLILLACLDVGTNVCFALGFQYGMVSVVAVVGSLYPVFTVLLARVVHDERLIRVQISGVAVALIGVALIAVGGSTH